MNFKIITILILGVVLTFGCNPAWEAYYDDYPETVDANFWDDMQNDPMISQFVQILKDHELDTLFNSDISYTLFVPSNDAMDAFTGNIDTTLLKYHICTHLINPVSVQGKRKIQTLTKKFILIEKFNSAYLIDGVEIRSESSLYRNGKFFVVNEVIEPKPNLYEYFRTTNPILAEYIDSKDSVVLNKELSVPIGYDENDNTIYDSVNNIINLFEIEYFRVKHEFRDRSATIVFPKQDDYHAALNVMADVLGSRYTDYNDIPLVWQNNILMPVLIEHGIFLNMLEPEEFIPAPGQEVFKLLNILGDSVVVNYTPSEKALCSNGYAYNYSNFQIPDSLYSGESKREGESLVVKSSGKFAWAEDVSVTSTAPFLPFQDFISTASNDSVLNIAFPVGYSGNFSIEFQSSDLFPRNYVLEVRTHMRIGGIYDIYVNDVLFRTFDYQEFKQNFDVMPSVVEGEWYLPDRSNLNSFDMLVDNITEYGPATIRFEYRGPGEVLSNGFLIDYISFKPAN